MPTDKDPKKIIPPNEPTRLHKKPSKKGVYNRSQVRPVKKLNPADQSTKAQKRQALLQKRQTIQNRRQNKKYQRIEKHYRFGIRSAYGQLVLLVFVPIGVLASVGAILVFFETTRAVKAEQDTLAQAALIRYEPIVKPLLGSLTSQDETILQTYIDDMGLNGVTSALSPTDTTRLERRYIMNRMYRLQSDQHVKRLAILDSKGKPMMVVGYDKDADWGEFDTNANSIWRLPTEVGIAYGMPIYIKSDGVEHKFWLFVDMDKEPLTIAYYRIFFALLITGLSTFLLLLFSLNVYSKRWIEPVYQLRLFLQKVQTSNLNRPFKGRADGEFHLLKRDLNAMFFRLNASFKNLKSYSDQTEADLQQTFDELEMKNISMGQALELAVSSGEIKSAFLANISHELRTPLNAIDGFVNLLARADNLDSKQMLYVQTIKKSSAHLLALIGDVLDFSKIEAGKLVIESRAFDFYELVYEVADMLSPTAFDKGLRMAVVYYYDAPTQIVGDKLRIKQVLTNLLGNAIKFTETGRVWVQVAMDNVQLDNAQLDNAQLGNAQLRVSVSDTGRGIDKETENKLFHSFVQGDLSVTRRYGGTGLGLVICKQLIELMGGQIGFLDNARTGVANNGATFWFDLPVDDESCEPPIVTLPSLNVLGWISDDKNVAVLRASLLDTSVTLTSAKSLAHLLEMLTQNNAYDWVIADSFGQQGDVTALLAQIRLHYQGKLMVFGYEVGLDGELLVQNGAYALHEPLNRRELYALLTNQSDTVPVSQWHGVRVLAVDDHLPNLLVLEALLLELGVQMVQANSGFAAIDIMTRAYETMNTPAGDDNRIDLIFMDISMPVMSGIAAAIAIRKIELSHNAVFVPIVALSAHGHWDEMETLYQSGINDYATKPIAHQELVALLQKWLKDKPLKEKPNDTPNLNSDQVAMVSADDGLYDHQPSNNHLLTTQAPMPTPLPPNETLLLSPPNQAIAKSHLAVVDLTDGIKRAGGKSDIALNLLQSLIHSAKDEKTALDKAWAVGDSQALADNVHKLLGASRYVGVPKLRAITETVYSLLLAHKKSLTHNQLTHNQPQNNNCFGDELNARFQDLLEALVELSLVDLTAIDCG